MVNDLGHGFINRPCPMCSGKLGKEETVKESFHEDHDDNPERQKLPKTGIRWTHNIFTRKCLNCGLEVRALTKEGSFKETEWKKKKVGFHG